MFRKKSKSIDISVNLPTKKAGTNVSKPMFINQDTEYQKFLEDLQIKQKHKKQRKFALQALVGSVIIALLSLGAYFIYSYSNEPKDQAILGVNEKLNVIDPAFETWSKEKTGTVLETNKDEDKDGLSNKEEFLLNSNPLSAHSCNPNTTDLENLSNLIDPSTCQKIDFNSPDFHKINQIINTNIIKTLANAPTEKVNTESVSDPLLAFLGVSSFNQIGSVEEQIQLTQDQIKQKQEYLAIINKIDEYVKEYRSYDELDKNYPTPVHPAVYLNTSIKYNTPLKYVLTIARLESRFGTDRFDSNGYLTRGAEHKNIYSMGLDDSGNNVTFESWENGVESFGRWYTKFEKAGVSDCAKWKIYNPNGDYCSKVENIANEIDKYLKD